MSLQPQKMEHLDAKAIRERLNAVMLAITTLEQRSQSAGDAQIVLKAKRALREISVLVTDDELEEHGKMPDGDLRAMRREIRSSTAARGHR